MVAVPKGLLGPLAYVLLFNARIFETLFQRKPATWVALPLITPIQYVPGVRAIDEGNCRSYQPAAFVDKKVKALVTPNSVPGDPP